jgi:hypothetical protein
MNFFLRVRKVWTGGISQVVEYLPNRHEALGSNLSTGKKKKTVKGCLAHILAVKYTSFLGCILNFSKELPSATRKNYHSCTRLIPANMAASSREQIYKQSQFPPSQVTPHPRKEDRTSATTRQPELPAKVNRRWLGKFLNLDWTNTF